MGKSSGAWKWIAFAASIVVVYLLIENYRKDKKIKELQKDIDTNEDLTKEVKTKLTELIQNNTDVDPQVANELGQIAALLEIKQDTSAVLKLAKIIENLLKELYKNDDALKEVAKNHGRRTPVFADYIEYGKVQKLISNEDYHLLSVLKIIRNEEAHELDVKKDKSRIISSFICGIGLVLSLCRRLKKSTLN